MKRTLVEQMEILVRAWSSKVVQYGRELPPHQLLPLLHSRSALWLQFGVSAGLLRLTARSICARNILSSAGGVVSNHFFSFLCLTNKAIRNGSVQPDAERRSSLDTEGQSALDWQERLAFKSKVQLQNTLEGSKQAAIQLQLYRYK